MSKQRTGPETKDSEYYSVVINDDPDRVIMLRRNDKRLSSKVERFIETANKTLIDVFSCMAEDYEEAYKATAMSIITGNELKANCKPSSWYMNKHRELEQEFDRTFGKGACIAIFQGESLFGKSTETGNCLIIDAIDQLYPHVLKCSMGAE